jgi:osmotically-inducible protein OsmY
MDESLKGQHGSGPVRSKRLFLATALGMTALAVRPPALAQAASVHHGSEAPAPEVVITGTRQSDAVLTAKVEQALQDDPYVFAAHMSVVTENGVVRLEGIALDLTDMYRALDLARRIAGKRRVVNEIELRNALWD